MTFQHSTVDAPATSVEDTTIARRGIVLALGATAMATTFYIYPEQQGGTAGRVGDIGGLAFQIGLFGLLATYRETAATGTGRVGRGWLTFVLVALIGATAWSFLHLVLPNSFADDIWMLVLDACWPLSMLAFLITGIVIAIVGRWRGALRWWPLLAEAWLPLSVAVGLALPVAEDYAGPTLMILLYGSLGLLMVLRPGLTRSDEAVSR